MKSSIIFTLGVAASASATKIHLLQHRQTNWTVGQVVQTNSGPVTGHPATNDSGVSEYLGIPFGQPPIGNLRFAAPVNFTGTAPLNGTNYGPSCLVQISNTSSPLTASEIALANVTATSAEISSVLGNSGAVYSEDCLYLNIWTKPQTGEAKKAVLVWIYGGGFNSGSSSIKGYNGANIVEQEDVIVVSFNYRLSILGFPGGPNTTQNVALLDQRLAVEWVRDNIANFGGDPSRITIFGQSAGAVSVDLYSYAWGSDPIVAGLISESGTAFSWGLPNTQETVAAAYFNVSATLGCGDASHNGTDVVACLRTKNAQDILNAIPASATIETGILGYFVPTIDDIVVFSNYSERTPASVPFLLGNNDYEAGYFRTEFALANVTLPDAFWTGFDIQEFTCPAGIRANASVAAKNPTWRYRYFGVFADLEISTEAGTWHGAELSLLFNTQPSPPNATADEISIGDYMRGAWATFAKDPAKGLTTYGDGWPTYNASAETLIRLAYDNITGTNLALPSVYDALCVYANVSSTNASSYLAFENLTSTTTTSSSSSSSPSPSGSSTGSAPATTTSAKSGGSRMWEISGMVVLGGVFAAFLI